MATPNRRFDRFVALSPVERKPQVGALINSERHDPSLPLALKIARLHPGCLQPICASSGARFWMWSTKSSATWATAFPVPNQLTDG